MPHKPVVFLAFANDRTDAVGYLRNLPDEARRLREVLGPAEQAGLCELVVRSNSTARDIFMVLQDPKYRNRIAIFHYGGHANGYQLLLESAAGEAAAADAGGLAAFLGQQQGLKLVFLNGCSTQQQTQGLLDANIPAVISTSRSIDDQVATDFAHQFYQGLAGGATIRKAFNEAEAVLQTAKGGNTRALYFVAEDGSGVLPEADRWPWSLYLREGSENADQWNLPDAVNNPLFGLPALPEEDLPDEPYRYLKWFTSKDAEVFFGRGHQIRDLYDRITNPRTPPVILLYGQAGVGKSSLLDAGVIPRLRHDHHVVYLRRRQGGLLDTLQLAFLPEVHGVPVETAWRAKEEKIQKPLVVVLDQVEEVFTHRISDVADELDQLLQMMKATFGVVDGRPQGKLVLGFRKEWLAELEERMTDYELPRTKVFLEPLDRSGIIEVVGGPARSERLRQHYRVEIEDNLPEIIADDVLEDRNSAIAPTLQVLLTKMWIEAKRADTEHPQFSQELYQRLKRKGILLSDFLNQQIEALEQLQPEAVKSGLLLDVVALHTTPLGMADKRTVEQLREDYAHLRDDLDGLLQLCQDLHLLSVSIDDRTESAGTTRLSHDTLAPLIRQQFEASDKPGQRARRVLDNRSVDWKDNRVGTPLDGSDLDLVEQGLTGTRNLSPTEQRLMEASRQLKEKLERNRMISMVAGSLAVILIAIAAVISTSMYFIADEARSREKTAKDKAEVAKQTADQSFQVCLHAIDGLLTQVSENLLINEPGMREFRRELLSRAIGFLDELKDLRSSTSAEEDSVADPMAKILVAMGRLHSSFGSTKEALSSLKQARDEVDGALPLATERRRELLVTKGNSWTETGRIYLQREDRMDAASMAFDDALDVRQTLVTQFPDQFELKRQLANAYMNKAIVVAELEDKSELAGLLNEARRIRNGLLADHDPKTKSAISVRLDAARQSYNMSRKSASSEPVQQLDHAIDELQDVLSVLDVTPGILIQESIFEVRFLLAKCYDQQSHLKKDANHVAALESSKLASEILEELLLKNPRSTRYRHLLGLVYMRRGGLTDSEGPYREAAKTLQPLDYAEYTQDIALAEYQLADFLRTKAGSDRKAWEEVNDLFERSVKKFERVVNNKYVAEHMRANDLLERIKKALDKLPSATE